MRTESFDLYDTYNTRDKLLDRNKPIEYAEIENSFCFNYMCGDLCAALIFFCCGQVSEF